MRSHNPNRLIEFRLLSPALQDIAMLIFAVERRLPSLRSSQDSIVNHGMQRAVVSAGCSNCQEYGEWIQRSGFEADLRISRQCFRPSVFSFKSVLSISAAPELGFQS